MTVVLQEHPLACHTFLQATMARGYLAQSEAKDLFEQVIGGASELTCLGASAAS